MSEEEVIGIRVDGPFDVKRGKIEVSKSDKTSGGAHVDSLEGGQWSDCSWQWQCWPCDPGCPGASAYQTYMCQSLVITVMGDGTYLAVAG